MILSIFKGFFGKKEPKPEPKVDFSIEDLKKGYILEYDLSTWEVKETATYNWLNGSKELEFEISDGKNDRYLNYSPEGKKISIYWEEQLNKIWSGVRSKGLNNTISPDDTFNYDNRTYHFFANGSANVEGSAESYGMQNWLFESDCNEYLVSFNKYEDDSMDAYVGKRLNKHEISNILPR
ncbi:MAG: DUF4178 domain-containing protein [Crocinitomicaceae bacterium]|nr:DUF4178 domain-containing protein [Crocinitomicaceae bacterium]